MDEQRAVLLIQALARCWSAIRDRHPDVPGVVLLPAPAQRRNVLGHFAPLRWRVHDNGGGVLHEVVVVAEYLNRSAEDIFETLVHEATHALNFNRGVRDCSASQYHNRKFKVVAEDLGLVVSQVRHYGFALTALSQGMAKRYCECIVHLNSVLLHREAVALSPPNTIGGSGGAGNGTTAAPTKRPNRNRKATCACGFIIRASHKTMQDTTIRCESCEEAFELV